MAIAPLSSTSMPKTLATAADTMRGAACFLGLTPAPVQKSLDGPLSAPAVKSVQSLQKSVPLAERSRLALSQI